MINQRLDFKFFVFTFEVIKQLSTYSNFNFPDDEERLREELKDLIDDNPIDEASDGDDSDESSNSKKRKKHDDDDELDDRLEDDDYDLIEENLGVKVERRVGTNYIDTYIVLKIIQCLISETF